MKYQAKNIPIKTTGKIFTRLAGMFFSELNKNLRRMGSIHKTSTPTKDLGNSKDLDPLLERIGDARVVLLGEASHGTHEFYTWRSAISKRLVEEKGFNFIAVEGDWPDCYKINRFVKDAQNTAADPYPVLSSFNRWPTWMWANWEVAALITWMKGYNGKHQKQKAGFYGLDVYSLWESMETLVTYLKKTDPQAARIAEKALGCFAGYGKDERAYAVSSLSSPCREEVVKLLKEVRMKAAIYNHDPEAQLNTTQNAYVAVEAEKYYRNMVSFNDQTWNIRDQHMMNTLTRLLEFHGPGSKAIVWEHNTHVGDARYTNMAASGMFNIGQLAREAYPGSETVIVGFGSYAGTVIAGSEWGAPMQEMEVPFARKGSLEEILHEISGANRYMIFDRNKTTEDHFTKVVPHRAIGVVYDPLFEKHNYVPTLASKRYDVFFHLDRTTALHPLLIGSDPHQVPVTFPFEY
jgi:erythromycin esterase